MSTRDRETVERETDTPRDVVPASEISRRDWLKVVGVAGAASVVSGAADAAE